MSSNNDPFDDEEIDLSDFLEIEFEDEDEDSGPDTQESPTLAPEALAIAHPGHTEKDEVLFRAFQFGTNGQVISEIESSFAQEVLAANWCGVMHSYRMGWGNAPFRC